MVTGRLEHSAGAGLGGFGTRGSGFAAEGQAMGRSGARKPPGRTYFGQRGCKAVATLSAEKRPGEMPR
jgi:hypothetical protein